MVRVGVVQAGVVRAGSILAGAVIRLLLVAGVASALLVSNSAFAETHQGKTIVTYPSGFAVSKPVSDLPVLQPLFVGEQIHEPGPGPLRFKAPATAAVEDLALQTHTLPKVSAKQGIQFEGIPSPGYVPSDSNLAVGLTEIVEVVNVQFAVYSKTGSLVAGPTNIQSLFAPLGGNCLDTFGDPVVLYDRPANRWVISMIGSPNGNDAAECIAVSQTSDPAGKYNLYGYSFGANLNDYPKLSTWATSTNSAYLNTYNIFANFQNYTGTEICGFDRTKMLAGAANPANLCQITPDDEFSYLPADLDGATVPVNGTPGLYISWQNNDPGQLYLRTLTLNFSKATATLAGPTVINVANDNLACGDGGECVPQKGTTQTLDSLGDRVMYRFAIRHFADHDRALVNHAVQGPSGVAIRWYEIFDPAGNVTLNQQGSYAPDATNRWMASLAEDQDGDIGMGYSASSSSIYPAVRFTGRVPGDPLGNMETEATILNGVGSQSGNNNAGDRWGDYTAMQIDPTDDCTFWYVDQYQPVTGVFDWTTSISSFAFSRCSSNAAFNLTANPGMATLARGGTAAFALSVQPLNGFSGSATLSASGLPTGVTATFGANPTSSSSSVTLDVGAKVAPGTYNVIITGVSGSVTETATLILTVTPPPNFGLTAKPTSLTVAQGQSGRSTITVTEEYGFTGTVAFSATAPSGVTASFSNSSSASETVLTLAASSTAPTGTSKVSVVGKSGSLSHTITLNLTVEAPAPTVVLSPTSLVWSAVTVGTTASPKTVTVKNSGTATLNLTNIATSGDFALASFTSSEKCGSTLAMGKSCIVKVSFTPTQTGKRTGDLTFTDNAGDSPEQVPLSGTGK